MYVHTYVRIHTYIHISIHTCLHTYMLAYIPQVPLSTVLDYLRRPAHLHQRMHVSLVRSGGIERLLSKVHNVCVCRWWRGGGGGGGCGYWRLLRMRTSDWTCLKYALAGLSGFCPRHTRKIHACMSHSVQYMYLSHFLSLSLSRSLSLSFSFSLSIEREKGGALG
jgi:hypothetical protein